MENKFSLGYRIKKSRKEARLSQKSLASALRLSDKTISSYEIGRANPSFDTLRQISKIVHKPINYFDPDSDPGALDLQIKIKTIEKELSEIKKLLKKK